MIRRLLLFLLLLPAPAFAQSVHGTILDPATGAPIAAVDVRVLDGDGTLLYSALASARGEFQLPLRAGEGVRLRFERIGYLPVTSKLLTLERAERLDLEIHLSPSAILLQPITVVAKRTDDQRVADFYRRAELNKRLGQGKIWTRADLERHPTPRISHLLRTVSARGGCRRREVFVDGLPLSMTPATGLAAARQEMRSAIVPDAAPTSGREAMRAPPPPPPPPPPPEPDVSTSVVDWLVQPEDVEGVEIYRDSEIPIEFNPDGELCQVTLIWHRSAARTPIDLQGAGRTAVGTALGILLNMVH